jgi:hypothetical protein
MRAENSACLIWCWLLLTFASCDRGSVDSDHVELDACKLIRMEEIQAIVGSSITEKKASEQSEGDVRVSQCFYAAPDFSHSLNVVITRRNKAAISEAGDEERRTEEDERVAGPEKIEGIGDQAFWTAGLSATLVVQKKDVLLRISVGGTDDLKARLEKSKALAKKALQRL